MCYIWPQQYNFFRMKKTIISLGTNLGDRNKNLLKAIQFINIGIGHITNLSGVYETEPWGFESNDKFLNMVVEVITEVSPEVMVAKCLDIEKKLGRTREDSTGYASRVIDIDILFYGDSIIVQPNLTIPHPYLHLRRFVLEPLCEIAPDFVHPILKLTISELLIQCSDPCFVKQLGSLQPEN